jgi:hypothetical protein
MVIGESVVLHLITELYATPLRTALPNPSRNGSHDMEPSLKKKSSAFIINIPKNETKKKRY